MLKPGGRAAFIASGAQAPKPARGDVQSLRPTVGRDRPHLERIVELRDGRRGAAAGGDALSAAEAVAAHKVSEARHFRGKLVLVMR